MPKELYEVVLSAEEIKKLMDITHKGSSHSARVIMHANILLKTNNGDILNRKDNREIAEMFSISPNTVNEVRKKYATEGLNAALHRQTRLTAPVLSKITGDLEAQIIAMALEPAPEGRARWTLRLLQEQCMERQYVVTIGYSTIGEMLNTNQVKPHLSKYWCIPKANDATFVAHMEDVLSIYKKAYNPRIPVICMDEKPIQLLDEIRDRIAAKPLRIDPDSKITKQGQVEKVDAEYARCGTASIFMFCEPLGSWRHVVARDSRKRGDYAFMMRKISDEFYPDVEKIIIVSDNLNTHNITSFYEAFPPKTALRLAQKYEFHYTPKHGSWLNIAEAELSSLARQCLGNHRINCVDGLNERLSAWEKDRNNRQKGVNWHFTAEDARSTLKRLYPEPLFNE